MAKFIKITQPGWETFSGHFGTVEFLDGVSTEMVGTRQIHIVGASVSIVEVDEDGFEGKSPALQDNLQSAQQLVAPILTELPRATEADAARETRETKDASKSGATADATEAKFHTQAELETVAETKGIAGLREISDPLGVKGRSINELVKEILKAEAKLKKQAEAIDANTETSRETDDMGHYDHIKTTDDNERFVNQEEVDALSPTQKAELDRELQDRTALNKDLRGPGIGAEGDAPRQANEPGAPVVSDAGESGNTHEDTKHDYPTE